MTAQEKYKEQYAEIQMQLSMLKVKLGKHKALFKKDSGNWGYVGSLNHVRMLLKEINSFLGK